MVGCMKIETTGRKYILCTQIVEEIHAVKPNSTIATYIHVLRLFNIFLQSQSLNVPNNNYPIWVLLSLIVLNPFLFRDVLRVLLFLYSRYFLIFKMYYRILNNCWLIMCYVAIVFCKCVVM